MCCPEWRCLISAFLVAALLLPVAPNPTRYRVLISYLDPQIFPKYEPTFHQYLNETAAKRFNNLVEFEAVYSDAVDTYYAIGREEKADFIFSDPFFSACLSAEFDYGYIATIADLREGYVVSQYGGVIVTLESRQDINVLPDLVGKRIATRTISSIVDFMMQWREMKRADTNPMMTSRQIIFTTQLEDPMRILLRGEADVAFMRADVLYNMINSGAVNRSDVKIVDEQIHLQPDRTAYPLRVSTQLYPEWPVLAAPQVPASVRRMVVEALLALNSSHPAAIEGEYHSWQAPLSYSTVKALQAQLELLDKSADAFCTRSDTIADLVRCPFGYVPLTEEELWVSCNPDQDPCPEISTKCICHPCKPACPKNEYLSNEGCSCIKTHTRVGGVCVSRALFYTCLTIAIVAVVTGLTCWRNHLLRMKNDQLWYISPKDLKFDAEPEVLGSGSYGVVLLATYRGSEVAVKQVVKGSVTASQRASSGVQIARKASITIGTKTGRRRSKRNTDSNGTRALRAAFQNARDRVIQSSGSTILNERKSKAQSRTAHVVGMFNRWMGSTYERRVLASRRRKQFIKEMRLLNGLRHPCITQIVGAVMAPGIEPMMVMEYMQLGSLHSLLHNETMTFESATLLNYMRDIVSGMRFLHSGEPPVIHADLKSHNVLVDSKHHAKVSDFGLSNQGKGVNGGTPFYMAPEILIGELCGTPSDVYSFAIVMYECLTRREPYDEYEEDELDELLTAVVRRKRRPILTKCPKDFEVLLKECWAPDPDDRPQFSELDRRFGNMEDHCLNEASSTITPTAPKQSDSDDLLEQVFPKHVAEALKAGRKVEPQHYECVTIFFSDIVGFTDISSSQPAEKVMDMLDRLYTKLDKLVDKQGLFKVETIGDAFMCVSNLHKPQPDDHVKRIALFSRAAIQAANETLIDEEDESLGYINIRVGFHSGPCVANVVGSKNPRYCLFGDTVNMASRMESNSEKNRIHMSESATALLQVQAPEMVIIPRGKIKIKGKGKLETWFLAANDDEPQQAAYDRRESVSVRFADQTETMEPKRLSVSTPLRNSFVSEEDSALALNHTHQSVLLDMDDTAV